MTEQAPPTPPAPDSPMKGAAYAGAAPEKDAVTMGMLCHLLGIFTWFLGPLIIWLMKKDSSPFVDDQGKEALNFQIAAALACLLCIPLLFIPCLGIMVYLAVHLTRIVFGIIGTIKANQGIAYRYPVTFRLIK